METTKKDKGKAFIDDIIEAMTTTSKALELQLKIQELPFYAYFEKKKLQAELTRLNLEQAQKGKKWMEETLSTVSEIFDLLGVDEERTPEENDTLRKEIKELHDRQARIVLLAIVDGNPLSEAIKIGQSYKQTD